ncbi:phosphotransferase family protein [Oceanobacillus sp. CF4.6]|uniref:phosphotransferase family protein n=1 Tax=Oceanobacillus sp. CF4.6 TaxID=3373080 RepID=UPI003EE6ACC9
MEIESQQKIDWDVVENYIRSKVDNLTEEKMQVKKFTEGYSNLTYLITIGEWEAVLRRPPFGYVPPKAHNMEREYRILNKVHPVFPLAPEVFFYCEDPEIMDKHFYIMERKNGIVVDKEIPEQYGDSPEVGQKISQAVVSTLAQLHSINYKAAKLESLGKPEGYLNRQVLGWTERFHRTKSDDIAYADEIEKWLIEKMPSEGKATIVHNDFKLNNMLLDYHDPRKVVGVFDWELSTIGDPLTDLASSLVYWGEPGDMDMGINVVTDKPGFLSRREFLEEYSKLTGNDVSEINYYLTFGFYKLAGVLQQLYYRWKIGEAKDERFSTLNQSVANLVAMANEAKNNRIL